MQQNDEQEKFNQLINKDSSEGYEEISEKKTSKLGYILLFMMAIFIIIIAQTVFSDLKEIPAKPNAPAYCIASLKNSDYLKNLSYQQSCRFTDIDKKFNLDSGYNNISAKIDQIASLNKQISSNEASLRSNEREVSKLSRDYELSLQEKMANEKGIIDKSNVKDDVAQKRNEMDDLKKQNALLGKQRDVIISQVDSEIGTLTKSYDDALEFYKNMEAYYKFKVFLLMLLFVLPFFAVSVYLYLKLKKKNSPYTIIFTAIAGASSFLFLQIVLTFLYDILPKEWLARIFRFFMNIPFLRYVIYYGSVILVIVIFGGIVYFIQKKVFSPEKVAIRRLKDNKCPGCSFTLNAEHNFCPKCGQKIKEPCIHCNNLKIRYLSHCPYCGKEKVSN